MDSDEVGARGGEGRREKLTGASPVTGPGSSPPSACAAVSAAATILSRRGVQSTSLGWREVKREAGPAGGGAGGRRGGDQGAGSFTVGGAW